MPFNKFESHAPIAAYPYRPRSLSISRERVQHEAGKVHILRGYRYTQAAENKLESLGVLRLNTGSGAFEKETFEAFVFK